MRNWELLINQKLEASALEIRHCDYIMDEQLCKILRFDDINLLVIFKSIIVDLNEVWILLSAVPFSEQDVNHYE